MANHRRYLGGQDLQRQHRGDCHTFAYRKDYSAMAPISGMKESRRLGTRFGRVSKAVHGQKDPVTKGELRLPGPAEGWGGFGFYFLEDRADRAYVKYPGDPAWLFDPAYDEAAGQQTRWYRRSRKCGRDARPATVRSTPTRHHCVPAVFRAWPGSMICWWGDVGSNAKIPTSSGVGRHGVVGSRSTWRRQGLQPQDPACGNSRDPELAPTWPYLGWASM